MMADIVQCHVGLATCAEEAEMRAKTSQKSG